MPYQKMIGIVLKNRIAIVKNVGQPLMYDSLSRRPAKPVWIVSAPRFPWFTGLAVRGLSGHAPRFVCLTGRVACSLLCCAVPRATVALAGASRRGFRDRDLRSEQRFPWPLRLRVPLRSSPPGHWLLSQGRLKVVVSILGSSLSTAVGGVVRCRRLGRTALSRSVCAVNIMRQRVGRSLSAPATLGF